MEQNILTLPIQVATRMDVGRLLRELEAVSEFLKQAAIREAGTPVKLPKTSRLADEFVEINKINLLHEDDLARAISFLIMVKSKAPVLHMSFSADPSPRFQQRLVTWLRAEIHPLALLRLGLQPNIGAGCVLRTPNKYFDFSLREHFKNNKQLLMTSLYGPDATTTPQAPIPEQPAAAPQPPVEQVAPTAQTAPAAQTGVSQ